MSWLSQAWGWSTNSREAITALGALMGGGIVARVVLGPASSSAHRPAADADRNRAGIATDFWLATVVAAVLLAAILLVHNWPVLTATIVPSGDAAADMLLVDRANHDWLLTGHYSRFGFNHPGPFFLYLRHIAESLAGGHLTGPYNAQLLAVIGGAALFLGMGAAAAAALVGGGWPGVAAALATLAVVLIQGQRGGMLSDAWMPNVLVAPFFAFVLLLAETIRGRLRLLPATTFCGGALAHGYVVLLPFVVLAWPLALAFGLQSRRQQAPGGRGLPVWPLAASLVIILLFVAPPLLDAFLHPPGNIARIVAMTPRLSGYAEPWGAALAFVAQYWMDLDPAILVAAGAGAVLALREPEPRNGLARVAAVVALVTLILVVAARSMPGPLHHFIGLFYQGALLALAVAAIATGLSVAMHGVAALRYTIIALAVLLAGIAVLGRFRDGYAGDPSLRALTDAIVRDARAQHDQRVRLQFSDSDRWAIAAGLLVDLDRFGQPSCVAAPELDFLFTPERICPTARDARHYDIVAAEACGDGCIARSGDVGIEAVPAR
jgi:hypothetical protein